MRILHILDHGLPMHSGYAFRTRAIVKAQMARGWEVACLTSARHTTPGPECEVIEGITFHRTPAPSPGPSPLGEWREVGALTARPYRFRARPWDLEAVESVSLVDTVHSKVSVQASQNQLLRVNVVDNDPTKRGWLSGKYRFVFG